MERDNDAEAMQAYSGNVSRGLRSEGGQVIDAYNLTYRQGICHTIKCNVDSANLTYVVVNENTNRGGQKRKKRFAMPLCADGSVPTITSRYNNLSVTCMLDTKHYPKTGIVEIYKNEEN